jgi:ketosteroid isomerase-like protein
MRTAPLVILCALGAGCHATTGAVDTRAEAAKIGELSRRWLALEESKQIDAIVELYADDAVELPSNTPLIRGRTAIREWYKGWLLDPSNHLTFETVDVVVASSGDLAYERGTYRFTMKTPKGSSEDVGKYVTVWTRVRGEWKVLADTNASDLPAPGA